MSAEGAGDGKIRVTVTNPDGTTMYSSWIEAFRDWRNLFCDFTKPPKERDGEMVGASLWDVPHPLEAQQENEKLRRILREMARCNYSANGAVEYTRERIGGDHAAGPTTSRPACRSHS